MAVLLWSAVVFLTSVSSCGLLLLLRALRRRPHEGTAASLPRAGAPSGTNGDELSSRQLARILGNMVPDTDDDAQPASGVVTTASATAPVPAGAAGGPTGQEILETMEASDHDAAVLAVQTAGTEAVNFVDDLDRNALLLAAAEGHIEACRALLARADFTGVDARSTVGATALHLAAGNDFVELCRLLLACPRFTAGINARDDRGLTPLDFAVEFGEGDARSVLEAAGGQRGSAGSLRQRRREREAPFMQHPPEEEDDADMGALD